MRALSVLAIVAASAVAIPTTAMAADAFEPIDDVVIVEEEPDLVDVYVGLFLGYKWGEAECVREEDEDDCIDHHPLHLDEDEVTIDFHGPLIGVNAGVNFLLGDDEAGGLFVGIVGDASWNHVFGEL